MLGFGKSNKRFHSIFTEINVKCSAKLLSKDFCFRMLNF